MTQIIPPAIVINVENDGEVAIENITRSKITSLEEINRQIKLKKEMLQDGLRAESDYSEAEEQRKEASRRLKEIRSQVMQRNSGLFDISVSIKMLTEEKKDCQLSLFDCLDSYQKTTGSNTITTDNGEEVRIVKKFSLKKKSEKAE